MVALPRWNPSVLRLLVRPWLLLSIGVHGVLLALPLLPADEPPELEVISLADAELLAPPPRDAADGEDGEEPAPEPVEEEPPAKPPRPAPDPARTEAIAPAPDDLEPPNEETHDHPPEPSADDSADSAALDEELEEEDREENDLEEDDLEEDDLEEDISTAWSGFPHRAEAEEGCGDLASCWRAPGRARSLAGDLQADLETQGYTVTQLTSDEETGWRIFRVSQDGKPDYYLNVISTFDQGTIYLLTEEPMDEAAIAAARG
jgi:hypothetical protein